MSSSHRIERDRGIKEARQQITLLREKWPFAFPEKRQEVRPLVLGAAREIAAAMGWSLPYTLGVLSHWKMAPIYSRAVLGIGLDGTPAEPVEAQAKELATKRLAQLAARKAAKKPTNVASPTVVTPEPPPTPPGRDAASDASAIAYDLSRRRGDLRGGSAPDHALRADQASHASPPRPGTGRSARRSRD
jgi:hypothetical protein